MKEGWRITFAMLMMILLGSCSNDQLIQGIHIRMLAKSDVGIINGRTATTPITFKEFMVGVTNLELETELEGEHEDGGLEDDDEEEVEFQGSYQVDLINGTSSPEIDLSNVTAGAYDEIEIKIGPVLSDGNSVFISFTHDDISYELSTTRILELEIEDATGYTVDENSLMNLLVIVNLDELLANIDLSQATADGDGVVRINDSSNTFILEQVISQFDDSCEAGEDHDHDDKFDDDHGN